MTFPRLLAFSVLLFIAVMAHGQTALKAPAQQAPDASTFVGAPQGKGLTGALLTERTNEVTALLRCPVCQGMSVADSPSEMAINMRRQVNELLARGYTKDQILKYFELSYGQFVLLKPKFEGVNALVWILPVAVLIAGALIVVMKIRRLQKTTPGQPQPATALSADAEYLARVRELVGEDKQ